MGKKKRELPEEIIVSDGAKTRTVVRVTEYEGKRYLDIRKLFKNDEGTWMATRKGISLPYERDALKDVTRAVRALIPAAEGE